MNTDETFSIAPRRRFPTTCWSVILAAADGDDAAGSQALEALCRAYWYPLYAYVRWRGHKPHDAQDLTQEFFASLLGRRDLKEVHPAKGKFRSYLLACLNHFLQKDWQRGRASKRGGGQAPFSLDVHGAEERYLIEPSNAENPERLFERRWALTIIENAMNDLRDDFARSGRADVFEALSPYLVGDKINGRYREIGAALSVSESAVKKNVQRMRVRYREHLRNQIAQTVASEGDIDGELAHLFEVLRS